MKKVLIVDDETLVRVTQVEEQYFLLLDHWKPDDLRNSGAKLFLIEMLKVRRTEANLEREIGNIPFEIRA